MASIIERITRPPWDGEEQMEMITRMRNETALSYHAAREGGMSEQEASMEARKVAISKFLFDAIEYYKRSKR